MEYYRAHMGNDDFPVYMTEFPMTAMLNVQMYIDLGGVRADQSLAVNITDNAYLMATSDLWTNKSYYEQIHSPAKTKMAERLTDMIGDTVYGDCGDISESCGPVVSGVEYGDGEITVTFKNVGEGLKFYGGKYGGGFTLNSEITPIPVGMFVANGRIRTEIKDPEKVQIIGKDKVRIVCDYGDYTGIAYDACSANCFPINCNLCNSYNIPACAFSSYK